MSNQPIQTQDDSQNRVGTELKTDIITTEHYTVTNNNDDKNKNDDSNVKQPENKETESKETQSKNFENKDTEIKETESKETKSKNVEIKDHEIKETQNIETGENVNVENTSINERDDQKLQQNQGSKSSLVKNRHLTTNEEKEILIQELHEYLKLPNRTTDRQNKERNVAKRLRALSPECHQYWNHKKVRDWFNNNNPDKRTKSLQDTEHHHQKVEPPKLNIMTNHVLGSAPIRFFNQIPNINQNIQQMQEINSQIFSKQSQSQFFHCYNPKTSTPVSSAILSLNSIRNLSSAGQQMQPTSLSESYIQYYDNPSSKLSQMTPTPNLSSSVNSSNIIIPINPNPALNQPQGDPIPQNVPYASHSPPNSFVSIVPYDVKHNIIKPQINENKIEKIEEGNNANSSSAVSQPANNEVESIPKSPNSGERISAEIPTNINIKSSPIKKKNSKFGRYYKHEEERIENLKRELDKQKPQQNVGPYTLEQQQMMSSYNALTPVFPLTIQEKYQKQRQLQQQQYMQMQQFNQQIPSQCSSAIYSNNKPLNNEPYPSPSSFIVDIRDSNPKSQFYMSSISKTKSKIKPNSDEIDPLPLVPEDEVKSFVEKLRSITATRITQLLKIIEDRRSEVYRQNLSHSNEQRKRQSKLANENINNKDDKGDDANDNAYLDDNEKDSNSKDKENENKEAENKEKEGKSTATGASSSDKHFILTHESQITFEKKTEERMNELIEFYHNNFGQNQPISLNQSIGITEKSVPPVILNQQSLKESGEFSPNNKHSSDEKIEDIINERRCVVNFGRKYNKTKIRVPKEIMKDNEKIIKFYRGEFDKKEVIPLAIYDSPTQVESSIFFNNTDEIFFSSYANHEQISLFVFNDSWIQAPFKQNTKNRSLCQFPHLDNLVLATDGDQLVCINTETMSTEFVYLIPSQTIKRKRSFLPSKSGSYGAGGNQFNINVSAINHSHNIQKSASSCNSCAQEINDKVAICATISEDIIVGINNRLYFFNRNKDKLNPYDSITLENMKKISSICVVEAIFKTKSESKSNSAPPSIPLIVVGSSDYPTIYAFDANDHTLVSRLVGHTSGISCLYGKGNYLFSGSVDGSIHKWEFRLIPSDQEQISESNCSSIESNIIRNTSNVKNTNYIVYAGSTHSLFMHTAPIVAIALGQVENIDFLISCDAHLIRATDLNRVNPSFSISIPEEFEINSLKFDGDAGEINFILASRYLSKFSDRLGIFSID